MAATGATEKEIPYELRSRKVRTDPTAEPEGVKLVSGDDGGKKEVQDVTDVPPVAREDDKPNKQPDAGDGGSAVRLIVKALGIYACFLYWGYMQEKVTTTSYQHKDPSGPSRKWTYMISLNMSMAAAAALVGLGLYYATRGGEGRPNAPFALFSKPAFTNTIASPIGYLSLRYIPFPLMLLVKNCKLIPVMLVGTLLNGVRYSTPEYVSVALISLGVVLFMVKPGALKSAAPSSVDSDKEGLERIVAIATSMASGLSIKELIGVGLASLNLLIDGFTNSEQDRLVAKYRVNPYYMMLGVNAWSLLFAMLYLLGEAAWRGWGSSEIGGVISFIEAYPGVRKDLLAFALSNALGQVFIFSIIEEFGSLVSVTVTITRKMFTILISIVLFGHKIFWWQWVGIAILFAGIAVATVYKGKKPAKKAKET